MAMYGYSVRTTNTTINNAAWEIRTAATNAPRLMELGIAIAAATACTFGFGRPAAIGVTPTSPQNFLAENTGDPTGIATSALAWGTSPTAPAAYHRRVNFPATIGSAIIWTWPRGFVVPVSSSVVVFNITASAAADMWAALDE